MTNFNNLIQQMICKANKVVNKLRASLVKIKELHQVWHPKNRIVKMHLLKILIVQMEVLFIQKILMSKMQQKMTLIGI